MEMPYERMKKRHEEEISAFLIATGSKGFLQSDDVLQFLTITIRHKKELVAAIKNDNTGENFVYGMFLSELKNNGYQHTRKLDDTLATLGFSFKKVKKNPILRSSLESAIKTIEQDYEPSRLFEPSKKENKSPKAAYLINEKVSTLIPEQMRSQKQWCAYKAVQQNGDYEKYLIDCNIKAPLNREARFLKWAKSNTPSTWTDYETARKYAYDHNLDGVAFALSGSGITCIDLDHQIDNAGKMSSFAQAVIAGAGNTYAERSVSGHGIHIFYYGSAPKNYYSVNEDLGIEVFDTGHFISITGNSLELSTPNIIPPSTELTFALQSTLDKRVIYETRAHRENLDLSDNEVIAKIRRSKKGNEFDMMWAGECTRSTPSNTDMAMCNMLAFFCGGDAAQVERIFRSSGLYREGKDKYLQHTVQKACASLCKSYDPNYGRREYPRAKAKPGTNGAGK